MELEINHIDKKNFIMFCEYSRTRALSELIYAVGLQQQI